MIRKPAVSGRFYPSEPVELLAAIKGFFEPAGGLAKAIGVVVPHAGYMYSGHVAGAVYSKIQLPSRNVILCPNHTGFGPPLSIMQSGRWHTPLGQMQVDEEMTGSLIAADRF